MDVLGIERRRLGTGLLAFGLVGMVLAGIIAVALVGGAFAARDLDERLRADQDRIAASLTRLTVSMESLALTSEHAGDTLQTSSDTLASAQEVLAGVADSAVAMAGALDVTILGSQPFGGASDRLAELARRVTGFQDQAAALGAALHTNSADADTMAAQVRGLKGGISEVAVAVAGFDRIDQVVGLLIGGMVLGALLTLWIAAGAAFCAWAGRRLRRGTPAGERAG